ncbi:hypothetical protein [Dyella sp.]|uniref:hypothetical protein n=1 Tax=Dyella sp. TaxID=1869338 RepID=UPI002D787D1C|nr:hypothetical protein [Dyella sp.]HET7331161.1 hypothetical protein [Dyella sp.]
MLGLREPWATTADSTRGSSEVTMAAGIAASLERLLIKVPSIRRIKADDKLGFSLGIENFFRN